MIGKIDKLGLYSTNMIKEISGSNVQMCRRIHIYYNQNEKERGENDHATK